MDIGKRQTVEIVDDDEAVRDSTQALLESYGFAVRTYPGAEAFLNAQSERSCDCLLIDQHMPGTTGVELIEFLEERGLTTPVVMLTAKEEPAFAARARKAGVLALLRKPAAIDELLHWIRHAVRSA